jgi:hypothetical protein
MQQLITAMRQLKAAIQQFGKQNRRELLVLLKDKAGPTSKEISF